MQTQKAEFVICCCSVRHRLTLGSMIDIGMLQTFLAVCEELNLTRAAAKRHLAPPSASAQIRKLEEALQLRLFERNPRGMSLTQAGVLLQAKAQMVVNASQSLLDAAESLRSGATGTLRLGLNGSPGMLRVGLLSACMQTVAPEVSLQYVHSSSAEVLDSLRGGEEERSFNAGFICDLPHAAELDAVKLQEISLVVAGPAAWRQELGTGDWEQLATCHWICSPGWCPFEAAVQRELLRRGLPWSSGPVADGETTKCELAEVGLGLAVLEASEAREREQAGSLAVWSPTPLSCELYFAWPRRCSDSPALAAVIACVSRVWNINPS